MAKNRHQELGLADEQVIEMYRTMLLARKIDERMWLLNRAGKIPFVISCQGQEAAQIGAAFALNRTEDYIAPYYRDMGVVLAFGMTTRELFLSAFAKAEDPNSGGRQMPSHFGQKKNRILTGSSPVTTQLPHAVGVALAGKMEKKDFVSFVTLGEGSSNQGDFHEGLNFAGVHKLPVITMVENNKYAISVPLDRQVASETVADRGQSYGMPGYQVNGNDPLEVYKVMKEARERAVNGEGPTLIEALTNRLTAHSSDDDHTAYRDQEEIEKMKQDDCVNFFSDYLKGSKVLTEEQEEEIIKDIDKEINDATEYAENAPYAEAESALKHVYAEEGGE
ncbi:thiamine pyrophosphate-dependent dehydrogenase E1 component subunit alpha [Tenuibacillus multivorans]|uniref:2-oxoisovalerate dehydrogenase subunit alpha n=1 Tax=Tenuibacillus multivorans TaxID=237069 RepID=A0A1G9Z753_9BACI|nr:thiamine pyrophosphate-dependent dehydrogenase E1 component subunit alpha [Tenuibacillus multivorans]GEL77392.1 2-oxoisovalerate dehydrogenase subunit alpha [Tenuibacillus multivorans]SDN16611.1 2-oxoisovalerate dehydrogenase E1 component alpha subunit [Tenuibacillus multivorans]